MFDRVRNNIREKLEEDNDFITMEQSIGNMFPDVGVNVDNPYIEMLIQLEDIIIEKAYLEGFKDSLKDQIEKQVKSSVTNWITINQVNEILGKKSQLQ